MSEIIRFNFEEFLQKHFGLVGLLHSDLDPADESNFDKYDIDAFFTKAGWDAWQRAIDLFDDMERLGLISQSVNLDITSSFCDNSF